MQPALVCFGQVILIPAFQPDGMSSTVSVSKLESEIWGRKGCDTGKDDPPGQVGQKTIPGLARWLSGPRAQHSAALPAATSVGLDAQRVPERAVRGVSQSLNAGDHTQETLEGVPGA